MKLTKRQLKRIIREEHSRVLQEANPDGTISPDEDLAIEDFLADVEVQIDELIDYIKSEAGMIGGPFRAPSIKDQAMRLLADKIHRER